MGLCFALPLAALASCLLPVDCCITCDPTVIAAVKSLETDYLPGHLDDKGHKKVMDIVHKTLNEFKELPIKEGSYMGAVDEKTIKHAASNFLRELKVITDSDVEGEEFVRQLYWMLDKEKGDFMHESAQFLKEAALDVFMLCNALDQLAKARVGSSEWRLEHLPVLGYSERPLLVQELWRAAWSRKPSGAAVSDGTCALLWQPEKNRSRVAPGGEALTSPGSAGCRGEESWENLPFWRIMSELSLHGPRNAGKDLALLTQCNHTTVTVGTFGFWAAYLAGGDTAYFTNFALPDSEFLKIWEDGSETLLYQGKNPIFTITSLTQKNTGTYRCELGTKTTGPSTIIHYLVTVLPPNATEETPTTSILFGSETESGTQGANVTGETSPAIPGGTGPASPTVQGETGPGVQGETGSGVQGETAPLQGETGPTEQGEMGPNQEDTGSTEQAETAPLQDGMGSLAQGETAPQVQGESGPLQGEMTSPDLVETAPVEAETAPLEAETAPLQGETTQPAQGETTQPAESETTQSAQGETTQPAESETTQLAQGEMTQPAQGETTQPFQVETAPLQGEMAPGEGEMASQFQGETNQVETAPLEEETAPPFQEETAPLQGEMAPGEGEAASEVQGEAAPPNQDEMAPFEEETEPGEFEMGQPLQNEMAPGQGEMTPPEQVETAPLQGEMTPPGQAETAQFQGEMATPVQGETSAAQGETASPIQAGMAQLQNEAALIQDETAPFLGETAPLVGDMAPLEETSVRPNPGELESSTTNQQPEQAKGTGAPSWRPQKNRSRAASGGAALASPGPGSGSGVPPGSGGKERSENLSLRRSVSELSLQGRRRRQQERRQQALSMAPGAADTQIVPADPGDFDQLTQCLIQAPSNRPYFLLLQGYQDAQDFVVYVMTREQHVFGRGGTSSSRCGSPGPYVDTFLNAPDILPRHCTVRAGPEPPAMVRPSRGAPVMHNGCLLLREAELHPGDLLGLGEHFLFMYKDPRTGGSGPARPPWLPARPGATPPGPGWAFSCRLCGRGLQERGEALAAYLDGREPVLRFRPREEEALLGEIVRTAASGAGDLPPLGPATLLALCVQHSARELELGHLPRLLGRLARLIKEAVWEKIKEIGDRQPENHPEGIPEVPLTPEAVSVELRPLMLWMANTTELLSFVQEKVLEMEKEADQEGLSSDPQLCNDLELCDEAMALLDEVIMCTFQQSVYYLTKTLYSTLPALLDSNPFTASADLPGPGAELGAMPPGLRPTLGVFQAALELTSQCELHPDLVSQTFGYLFFFSNASLLNSLMERGQGRPFYQWSRAVQIRTNLDLVLDWLQGAGLGDIATEFFRKLSIAVNLLCVPRTSLLKASWSSLRTDHSTLTPAQLHHLLSHYQLGPGRGPPPAWDPPPAEQDAVDTGDIFESFSSHPPLILPLGSSRLRLTGPVTDDALHRELRRLRRLLWDLEQQELPANHRHGPPVASPP
uniref:ras-interacting protein 1 n=1 Tax=Urocitellus parryii TaxID=9999 RepID=UPI000E55CDD8|nr:ras-interacting protein 1 [Urocitellus parryii]